MSPYDPNVLRALNRKGGDLVAPGQDDLGRRQAAGRKKRGRKNKYYRQIDHEDGKEAKRGGDPNSSEDGELRNISEQDEEDEEEIQRRRNQVKAQREEAQQNEADEAERLRQQKAALDLRLELDK